MTGGDFLGGDDGGEDGGVGEGNVWVEASGDSLGGGVGDGGCGA